MSRDNILHRIRTALGRSAGQAAADPPPARIRIPDVDMEKRISTMFAAIEALAGKTHRAATPADARAFVAAAIEGQSAVASNAPYLAECGIATLPACAPASPIAKSCAPCAPRRMWASPARITRSPTPARWS